jgi:Fic family protein
MILNNFNGLEFIRDHREPLTPEVVLELHRILAVDTLDPADVGRLQHTDEERVAVTDVNGNVLHRPPPADELEHRLADLCAFANGELNPPGFLHPVMRAILIHFWLAYDHPFVDGNGRTARALFYWSMLRAGYWLTEYLSISRILRAAPAKYGRSFLYTESDDGDTTYFALYQLSVICRAIDDLHDYLARKMAELRDVERTIKASAEFNPRQLALLGHAMRHPETAYTFEGHRRSHGIVYQSARSDILDLAERGLLVRRKLGRKFVFDPAPGLAARLGR